MKFLLCNLACAGALALATATLPPLQGAQSKSKPPAKPPQGAVQMPGDNGKLGVPYQLGKKGDELVFTLEKAEFASRALMKDTALWPKDGERLLVITYAVQNPASVDRQFFSQSFSFTVVSPDDQDYVCDGIVANGLNAYHPDRKERLAMQLKPAQKVRAITVIQIHPKGPVNKLIVQRGKGTTVLRYDLKEKVKPMTGAYAADNGMDILDVGRAKLTVPYDHGIWDVTVEKCEDVLTAIGSYSLYAGEKWIVLTVSFTNAGMYAVPLHNSMITGKFYDADGAELPQSWIMLKNSTDDAFNGSVDAGATVRLRMLYKAPLACKAGKVQFRDANSYRLVNVTLEKPKD